MSETPISARELIMERIFRAPRARVFEAWTDPKQLAQWWGPHGMTNPVVELDPRPGGIFKTVMRDPEGKEYPYQGVYLEVVAPERIIYTDAYAVGWIPVENPFLTTQITLEDHGDETKMIARALHWSVADRDRHLEMGFNDGWGQTFERLKTLLEG